MTGDEARMLWLYMAEQWPNYELPADDLRIQVREQVWLDTLSDLDAGDIRTGIASLADREFPPTVGIIRVAVQRAQRKASGLPEAPDVDAALNEFFGHISRVGHVGKPEWSHPALESVVRALGGWLSVCSSTSPEALRAHFRQLYGEAATRDRMQGVTDAPVVASYLEAGSRRELTA